MCFVNPMVCYSFGELPKEEHQIKKISIKSMNQENVPEPLRDKMKTWGAKARNEEIPIYYVKLAQIKFEYEGNHYELFPNALRVDDARFEIVATDILKDMENMGCKYGLYMGFMD